MDLGIDGIEQVTPIGAGGSATVYRAEQPRLGRTVAVKVITGTTDEKTIRRFEREARALGTLSENPGIVTVYEVGTTKLGSPFLVMQYCPGGSLQDLIAGSNKVDPQRAAQMISQVADTLAAAHARGVVHRDLKPANLLIDRSGRTVVADFGIAALAGTANGVTKAMMFTPGFIAPENLQGAPPTAKSDVYAVGATLYALVTGTTPFVNEATEEGGYAAAIRALSEDLPDTRALGVPDQVASAIELATERDPDRRPDMSALARLLRGDVTAADLTTSLARGPATVAPAAPPPVTHPPSSTTRPSTSTPPPAMATTEMSAARPAATTPPARPHPTVSPPIDPLHRTEERIGHAYAPEPASGSKPSLIVLAGLALVALAIGGAIIVFLMTNGDSGDNPDRDGSDVALATVAPDPTIALGPTEAVTPESTPEPTAEDNPAQPITSASDPLGLCSEGGTLIFGGETGGVAWGGGDVRAAICADSAGNVSYHGLETGTNAGIKVRGCMVVVGQYRANNRGSIYLVTNGGTAERSGVTLTAPNGEQQFNYTFDDVFVGEGSAAMASRLDPC